MSDFFNIHEILHDHDTTNSANILLAVNQLPVRLLDFVVMTGLKNRGYGVRTWGDPTNWERDWLNDCARIHLWRLLYAEQQNLFSAKRITLVPTYHVEEHTYTPGQGITLKFPYVSAVNVTRTFVEEDEIVLSPYLESSINVTPVATFFEAEVPKTVIHNIQKVWFREDDTHENAPVQYLRKPIAERGYPYTDGTNWAFALGNDVSGASVVHAQDSDYTHVDIDPIADHTINEVVFMHPDQDQELIQALSPQSVTVGATPKWRFWFYYWMMKRPEYSDMQVDLSEESPFRYFYETVRYGYYTETETPGKIYAHATDCAPDPLVDPSYDFFLKLIKGDDGVALGNPVKLNADTGDYELNTEQVEGVPYKIRVYYKTDIQKFDLYVAGIEYIKQAIIAKVAANLPLEECDCGFSENNYITRMREDLPEIIPVPFAQPLANYKYGRRRGDQEYAHLLQHISVKGRRLRL